MSKAKAEPQCDGLAEPGRVRSLEELLSAMQGVEYAHVNLGAGKVSINFDDELTSTDVLMNAVYRAGFDVTQQ